MEIKLPGGYKWRPGEKAKIAKYAWKYVKRFMEEVNKLKRRLPGLSSVEGEQNKRRLLGYSKKQLDVVQYILLKEGHTESAKHLKEAKMHIKMAAKKL